MNSIPRNFTKFNTQLSYILMTPIFFATFVLIYSPMNLNVYLDMNDGWFPFNLAMISSIILVTLAVTRITFYFLRDSICIGQGWYSFYCGCEILVIAHFITLYNWLMFGRVVPYFEVLAKSVQVCYFILIYPYVIIGLALRFNAQRDMAANQLDEKSKIRFYDYRKILKLVVPIKDILYIKANENYVDIFYLANNKIKTYKLRSSLKNVENICQVNNIVQCHRSYLVNITHVKLLYKDPNDGFIYAELDENEAKKIPVTKTYYDSITTLL